jgi:hypothetical protein
LQYSIDRNPDDPERQKEKPDKWVEYKAHQRKGPAKEEEE